MAVGEHSEDSGFDPRLPQFFFYSCSAGLILTYFPGTRATFSLGWSDSVQEFVGETKLFLCFVCSSLLVCSTHFTITASAQCSIKRGHESSV